VALNILSAGAAQGVATAFADRLRAETGHDLAGTFGAVGMIREKFLGGEPADLVILTAAQIADLVRDGHIVPGSSADLGVVRTGVAVRAGDVLPGIGSAEALRASLLAADAIYFPDPERATAGIHFARVLDTLGIRDAVGGRLRPFSNGATAMRELSQAKDARPIGCTQVTEINNTPGVTLVGLLPREFELATTYSLGVPARATVPEVARKLAGWLTGPESAALRSRAGFEIR
jgi:molybdate transport system substrate-binding protein